MNDRDKIDALWLNLEMIMNALEDLGEDLRFAHSDACYAVVGDFARVRWDDDSGRWEVTRP